MSGPLREWLHGQRLASTQRSRTSSFSSTSTIGFNADGVQGIVDLASDDEVIDLTIDENQTATAHVRPGESVLSSINVRLRAIKAGDFLEVDNVSFGQYEINFILVTVIVRTVFAELRIRGVPYSRTRNISDMLPKKQNEVCEIHHTAIGDVATSPALVEVGTRSITKVRKLVTTNGIWPLHSTGQCSRRVQNKEPARNATEDNATLVCRWRFEIISEKKGNKFKPTEEALVRIHESQVSDSRYRVSESTNSNMWRGRTTPGGSWFPNKPETTTQAQRDDNEKISRKAGQKYTLFDSFAGAGGVSRGAQMAGLKATHAIDNAIQVWPTYEANFTDACLFRGSINEYIAAVKRHPRVDFLHLSPPCQFFSPAHTRESIHDDTNTFPLLSCGELVGTVRPRLVTVEQTFGLTHERHKAYFRALIHSLTDKGYSIRWKVVRLCTWGCFQDRKRLIIIAAAPGERLPPFPTATHSSNIEDGLPPFATIRKALDGIRPDAYLHDVRSVKQHNPPKPAYDPDRLAGTLTTSGADFCYPDGSRDFTLREFANLQGFPIYHRFMGTRTSIKRQIGNAFPPNTVRVLYQHLETWLLHEDGMARCTPQNVVCVDDDDVEVVHPPQGYSDRQQNIHRVPNTRSPRRNGDTMDVDTREQTTTAVFAVSRNPNSHVDLT